VGGFDTQEFRDRLTGPIDVVPHVIVTESDDPPTSGTKKILALSVGDDLIVVVFTIDFDDQTMLDTGKVDEEAADRMLATEFQAAQTPSTQGIPQ